MFSLHSTDEIIVLRSQKYKKKKLSFRFRVNCFYYIACYITCYVLNSIFIALRWTLRQLYMIYKILTEKKTLLHNIITFLFLYTRMCVREKKSVTNSFAAIWNVFFPRCLFVCNSSLENRTSKIIVSRKTWRRINNNKSNNYHNAGNRIFARTRLFSHLRVIYTTIVLDGDEEKTHSTHKHVTVINILN